jgi:colanic acid/amylovoran biosynthesis glycosyltransferase
MGKTISRKKIGIVLAKAPGYSETFLTNKINGLSDLGYEIILFSSSSSGSSLRCKLVQSPQWNGSLLIKLRSLSYVLLTLLFLTPKRAYSLYKLSRGEGLIIRRAIRLVLLNSQILRFKLDWLHFGFGTMAIGSEAVAKVIGAKMAMSLRGYDTFVYPLKHSGCYNKAWKYIDKLHVISESISTKAKDLGMPDFVDTMKISPAIDLDKYSFFLKKEPFKEPLKIITISRLHWVKGLLYTLEALAELKNRGFHFEFTIIGNGDEFEQLKFATYQLGIIDEVFFLRDVAHENIPGILAKSDLYIQYSLSEGFGNAVLEAQASGLLCIVSDAGGLPENVIHNKTGWIVKKCSPILLCQRIIDVLQLDEDTINKIRIEARERIIKEFNLKSQLIAWDKFYQD